MDNNKFKKDLEKLLKKNEDSLLAIYIAKCLKDFENKSTEQVNPFGIEIQPILRNSTTRRAEAIVRPPRIDIPINMAITTTRARSL